MNLSYEDAKTILHMASRKMDTQKSNLRLHPFIPCEYLYPTWKTARVNLERYSEQHHPHFTIDIDWSAINFNSMYLLGAIYAESKAYDTLLKRLRIAHRIIRFENRKWFKYLFTQYYGQRLDEWTLSKVNTELYHYECHIEYNRQHTIRDVINHYAGSTPCYY